MFVIEEHFSLIEKYTLNGNLDGLNELIALGADINEPRDNGNTPLHYASHLNIANALITAGAEIDKTNIYGNTPLHYASSHGRLNVANALISAGAEVNKTDNYGGTPLHWASGLGRFEVVKALILAKADVRIKNKYGELPHEVAKTDEIREFIWQHHLWYRRKPLILTRPHPDLETNKEHELTALGNIMTATSDSTPDSHDDILYQLKMKIAEFL